MKIRKSILGLFFAIAFIVGGLIGYGGAYYHLIYVPQKNAQVVAEQQKQNLNEMLRRGRVVNVEPEKLSVRVDEGSSKTITVKVNESSSVQIGMNFINQSGEKLDMTKWFQEGDLVDLLVEKDQAIALHREVRPGERIAPTFQQTNVSTAESEQSKPEPNVE